MGAIDVLFSSPIPTAISMVVALALGLLIWFWAIPQSATLKKAQTSLEEKDVEIKELRNKHTDDLKRMSQTLDEILTAVERPISIPILEELKSSLSTIMGTIRGTKELDATTIREITSTLSTIDRNTERLLRTVSEVSEKQSQVSGIILGISMQRGGEPRQGV